MATTHAPTRSRQARRHEASRGARWMSDRQLDAYLQARETLRRLRTATALTTSAGQAVSPPVSQG